MCTGAEPALLAATAEAAPVAAAATTAATAATALPVIAPVATEVGLGSLMAGSALPEIAAPVIADTAGATLAASELAPTAMAAAEAAPTTLAASNAAVVPGMSTAPGAAPSLSEALGSQMGQSLSPELFNGTVGSELATGGAADTTFLGMTPTQWTQQLVTQGGSAGMQMLGAMQSQDAQRKTADAYQAGLSEFEKEQLAAVEDGMKGFTPEAIAANRKKYADEMVAGYDSNAPQRESFGSILLGSTPDEVKQDYAKKQAESNSFARNQFSKSVDLTSLGRAMTSGAQGLQDALTKASMNKGVINSYMSTLPGSMDAAGGAGTLASGLGNLTSSLGNLMLANQKATGKTPSSITDIR